jgi:hypothetical protein
VLSENAAIKKKMIKVRRKYWWQKGIKLGIRKK